MVEFLDSMEKDSPALSGDIHGADIVVGVGRGLMDADGYRLAVRFAECLSAQIGGTRAAQDLKWISHHREIGLSGLRLAPKLYIGCGVSGTNFHTIGIEHAGIILGINTDPKARIFTMTEFPIIAEVREVLTSAVAEMKRRKPFSDSDEAIAFIVDFLKNYNDRMG